MDFSWSATSMDFNWSATSMDFNWSAASMDFNWSAARFRVQQIWNYQSSVANKSHYQPTTGTSFMNIEFSSYNKKMSALERRQLKYGQLELSEETLGLGSYGKVYRAKYGQLPCAAKVLHETLFQHGDPGEHNLTDQFDKECRFLSTIHHPNIVQYLQTVRIPGSARSVLVMELMDESLTSFLKRSATPLSYSVQVGICHDISLALSYLHLNNIIHRDLSSNNILLTAGRRAKVTDFGMSKYIDHMTKLTKVPGAEVYMPPEAKTTPPHYSAKLDCFSFGVLMIQIATRNFPAPTEGSVMVDDPNYPTGQVVVPIPERERRKADIDRIKKDHPLRETALACISDRHTDRSTSHDICENLTQLRKVIKMEDRAEEEKKSDVLAKQLQEQKVQRVSNENLRLREQLERHTVQHQNEMRELRKTLEYSEQRVADLSRQQQQYAQDYHHLRLELEAKKREISEWRRSEEGLKNRLDRNEQVQRDKERVQIKMGSRLTEAQQECDKLRSELERSRLALKQRDEEIQNLKTQLNTPAVQPQRAMERAPGPLRAATSSPQQTPPSYPEHAGMVVRRASDERPERRPYTQTQPFHPSPPPTSQARTPNAARPLQRPAQPYLGPTQHYQLPPTSSDRSPTAISGTNRKLGMAGSRYDDRSPTGVYTSERQHGIGTGHQSSTNAIYGAVGQPGEQVKQHHGPPRANDVGKVEERQQLPSQSQHNYPYRRQNQPQAQPPQGSPYQPVQRPYPARTHPQWHPFPSEPNPSSSQPHPSSSKPHPSSQPHPSSSHQVRRASAPQPSHPKQAPVQKSESMVEKTDHTSARKPNPVPEWKLCDAAKAHMTRYDGQVTAHTRRQVLYFTHEYTPYEYHLEKDKWEELPRCDNKKFSVAFVNDRLTVIGGLDSKDNNSKAVLYLQYREWKSDLKNLPFMTTGRAHPGVLTTPTHLIVAGGAYVERNNYGAYDSIEIFNLTTRVWWTATTKLPMTITHPQLVHTNNISRMMLYDTETNLLYSTSLDAMLQQDGGDAGWMKKDPVPYVKEGSSLVKVRESLLAIGGKDELGDASKEIYIYDKIEGGWSRVKDMGTPRYWALTAVALNNSLVVVGGFKGGEKEACTLTETIPNFL